MDYLILAGGLVLLVIGADFLVRGGVAAARRLGVSPLMMGLTVVAWGTSLPELIVTVDAAMSGYPGLAVGNVVGSNIFNIVLILGLTVLIAPIAALDRGLKRDLGIALLAAVMFIAVALTSERIEPWHGVLFLGVLIAAVAFTYMQERRSGAAAETEESGGVPFGLLGEGAALIGGLVLLVIGANFIIDGAVAVATAWGVSDTIIGLTLVAGGTSLPELAASTAAALRRQPGMAVGNVVGSNIYNILAILGVGTLITPIPIDPQIAAIDMWLMLGATLALIPAIYVLGRIGRLYGLAFLTIYVVYVAWLFTQAAPAS